MKIINKLLIISFLILSFSVNAKETSHEASLNSALDAYQKVQLDGDFEKSVDFIYTPMFKMTSKEDMIKGLKAVKESGMSPKITKLEQKANFPVQKYSKGVYTTIPYTMDLDMNFAPPSEDKEKTAKMEEMLKDPKELAKFQSFMGEMLKMSMGEIKIKFKKNSLQATISKSGSYLAINEENTGWKFLDLIPASMNQVKDILPKEILNALDK